MNLASMPETAVYEYGHVRTREHHVRTLPGQVGQRCSIDPIAQASSVNKPPNAHFGLCVSPAVTSHHGTSRIT